MSRESGNQILARPDPSLPTPGKTQGKSSWVLKRTIIEKNGESIPRILFAASRLPKNPPWLLCLGCLGGAARFDARAEGDEGGQNEAPDPDRSERAKSDKWGVSFEATLFTLVLKGKPRNTAVGYPYFETQVIAEFEGRMKDTKTRIIHTLLRVQKRKGDTILGNMRYKARQQKGTQRSSPIYPASMKPTKAEFAQVDSPSGVRS